MARIPLPPPAMMSQRRVVVTGLGAVTPLANGMQATWERLLEGACGIKRLRPSSSEIEDNQSYKLSDRVATFPTTLAGVVERGLRVGQFPGPESVVGSNSNPRGAPAFIEFAAQAAREALQMSGWVARTEVEKNRAGVAIGSGIGSLEDVADAYNTLQDRGYRRLTPRFIPRILINLAAGHVAIEHGLKGPNHAAATACATGAHAIGDAYRFIKHGDADVMVCGGSEGSVHEPALAGFARMNALSTRFNDQPERASRPFDKERDGFVLAEGAAVLVLEEMEHALERGANILAEVRGYGLSGDAHHVAAPTEDGDGPGRAMLAAIEQSGLSAGSIGYVNAHATSTPLGDAAEGRAIERVFGRRRSLLVSSTKGATGHLLGAAGPLEAAFSILALRDGFIPHTLNLDVEDPEFGFTFVKDRPGCNYQLMVSIRRCVVWCRDFRNVPLVQRFDIMRAELDAAISNSFGFGGTNVSLLFSRL